MSTADQHPLRFAAIDRLYGAGTAARFARANVAIVGLGGVGSWIAEALARSGFGHLSLIDADEVCVSNTNRQLHALDGTFGRVKVEVLAERLRAINPQLQVSPIAEFLTEENLARLLEARFDYVIDACDSVRSKVAMIVALKRRKIPLLTIGAAGGRIDPARIDVRDLSKTVNDALLAEVRRKLRDDHGWTRNPKRYFGIQAIYSREAPRWPLADGSVSCQFKLLPHAAQRLDCGNGLGAAMHVTASFGMLAVARMIDRMLERKLV